MKYIILKLMKFHSLKEPGKLRYHKVSLLVGDNVKIKDGLIIDVIKRHNSLIRPKVANIDQAIIFMSIQDPEFSSFLVDKYLSLIEFQDIKLNYFYNKGRFKFWTSNEVKKQLSKIRLWCLFNW